MLEMDDGLLGLDGGTPEMHGAWGGQEAALVGLHLRTVFLLISCKMKFPGNAEVWILGINNLCPALGL